VREKKEGRENGGLKRNKGCLKEGGGVKTEQDRIRKTRGAGASTTGNGRAKGKSATEAWRGGAPSPHTRAHAGVRFGPKAMSMWEVGAGVNRGGYPMFVRVVYVIEKQGKQGGWKRTNRADDVCNAIFLYAPTVVWSTVDAAGGTGPASCPGCSMLWKSKISEYIITFHVSTGRSASLKLQSKGSSASGSSVGS